MLTNMLSELETSKIVSHETIDKVYVYLAMIKKWNNSLNLISKQSSMDLDSHVVDAIFGALNAKCMPESVVFDLGSGNGLPGIIFGILGFKNVYLIDQDVRKSVFLMEVNRLLGLNLNILNINFHYLNVSNIPAPNFIISKAVGSSKYLCDLISNQYGKMPDFLFFKNKSQLKEIEDLKIKYSFDIDILENESIKERRYFLIRQIYKK